MTNIPLVIGFAGPAGCGKDTAAAYVDLHLPEYDIRSFASPLKQMLMTGLDLSAEQVDGDLKELVDSRYNKTPRYLMQTLDTEWGRYTVNGDLWVNVMRNHIQKNPHVIISDVRFENEAKLVREFGVLIHIERVRQISNEHVSEHGVHYVPGDLSIRNYGTLEEFHALLRMALKL